jgi:hypothetical protein
MADPVTVSKPWGEPLTWPEVQRGERTLVLRAGPADLAVVAHDLGLEALASLEARIVVRPWLDGVEIDGRVLGRATRLCGVSLEPFDVEIDEPIGLRVVPVGSPNAPRSAGEVIVDLDAEDPPDEATGPTVDLTAYVVEAFALALDPFPRKPGVVFEPPETSETISPFAVLAKMSPKPSER